MKLFILLAMIFAHIVDDYYLQGILAKMKQKQWWKDNAPSKIYQHDYIVALIMHAFSWSFMITLPTLLISNRYFELCFMIAMNTVIHAYVDHQKANEHRINLITDQLCHLVQIVGLWLIVVL